MMILESPGTMADGTLKAKISLLRINSSPICCVLSKKAKIVPVIGQIIGSNCFTLIKEGISIEISL